MEFEESKWNVLRTRSRQEYLVENALLKKDVEVFLPKLPGMNQVERKSKQPYAPMFPGYVFVKPQANQVYALRFIPGSCGLLMGRKGPAEIRHPEMESIRILVKTSLPINHHSELIPGTRVRVIVGPLRGVEGELVRMRNHERLILNSNILGQAVSVEININEICRVEAVHG